MPPSAAESGAARVPASAGRLSRLPAAALVVAVLAGLLHLVPYWRAQSQTPEGWTFTGNLYRSPDFMQYRVWLRQSQGHGVVVPNKFTAEANQPYIPVFYYYAVGAVSRWLGKTPEFVLAHAASLIAGVLVLLLFVTVRLFLPSPRQHWWVFFAILAGGGLGAHIKLLRQFEVLQNSPVVMRLLFEPVESWLVFEDYRGHYVFLTLFDPHFLVIWLATAAAVVSLYLALRRPTWTRFGLLALLDAAATLLHVYEGVTLVAVTLATAMLCWRRRAATRAAWTAVAVCAVSVGACCAWMMMLQQSSGVPAPVWRAVNILFAILVISYPLAWAVIAWGLGRYWQQAGLEECFLLGWILGCTALVLSGPFYPYPDRGTMTLQIPLYLAAGCMYFRRRPRLAPRAALVAILLLGATPGWAMMRLWRQGGFDPDAAYKFVNGSHRETVEILRRRAGAADLLAAEPEDLLWLAPEYPGKHYSGHFFWTVKYDRKQAALLRFFEAAPEEQAAFLRREGIRFLFVGPRHNVNRLREIPGLVPLKTTAVGALFEYRDGTSSSSN